MHTVLLLGLLLLHAAVLLWWAHGNRDRDRLTGLATRDGLDDVITRCATRAVWRADYRYAVLVLELDDRTLRRTVGRFGVEDAIADTAERLSLCTRGTDVVARIADRRFGVVLDDVSDVAGAMLAARRLVTALDEASTLSGRRVRTTPSVGLAISAECGVAPEAMIARAEASLGQALSPACHQADERGLLGGEPGTARQLDA
jgi:GGDEF domain-containing protein